MNIFICALPNCLSSKFEWIKTQQRPFKTHNEERSQGSHVAKHGSQMDRSPAIDILDADWSKMVDEALDTIFIATNHLIWNYYTPMTKCWNCIHRDHLQNSGYISHYVAWTNILFSRLNVAPSRKWYCECCCNLRRCTADFPFWSYPTCCVASLRAGPVGCISYNM